MAKRLRVGIIGLGRRWPRYRQALRGLRKQVAVRALCDQVARAAEEQAGQLRCAAAAGPSDLLERADVDAVLLLGAQWYGLWPLERACRVGKPVFCAVSLARDEGHADDLCPRVRAARLPVLMALPVADAPATGRLRGLLAQHLGPARFVRADRVLPPSAGPVLHSPAVLSLIHACADLLGDHPVSVRTTLVDARLATLVLEFPAGRAAQVTLRTDPVQGHSCRLEAVADRGTGVAHLPGRVRWRDAAGLHQQTMPRRGQEQALLERFLHSLRTGQPPRPDIDDAYRALTWWRAALRSEAEDRRVPLDPPPAEGSGSAAG